MLDRSLRDKGLGKGVRQGRIWAYVRDQRPWAGASPPGAVYRFAPDWKEEHVLDHLADARGILQADGYKGYAKLYAPEPGGNPRLREAACWAQRVTIDNQIRGLVVVFGVRLPRALPPAFKDAALAVSDGVPGFHAALCGLFAAREAILTAVTAIDGDIKKMTRRSKVCQRLMTVPGVGPITALAFAAAIDDPQRFRKSRDVGAYLGLVPQRHRSGGVDYSGSISKRGDVKVRTLLYEAANVMLTRYSAPLKLKSWALAIAARSTMRKARVALARSLAVILHAIMRDQTNFKAA